MAAAAAVAAAAVSAAATIATSTIAATSKGSGGGGAPNVKQIAPPGYQKALQHYTARLIAQNETAQPPSFGQYVQSGGQATFPIVNPGFTPKEAMKLGIVGHRGEQIPYVDPSQSALTRGQQLYLGHQQKIANQMTPLEKAYLIEQRLTRLEGKPQTEKRQAREQRMEGRQQRLLGGPTGRGTEF